MKKTIKERDVKICFILSVRKDFDKSNEKQYKSIIKEYKKMTNKELKIEYNFYYENS